MTGLTVNSCIQSGVLTGTLPRLSQQNVFLGLLLVLLPEELDLLVEKPDLVPVPTTYTTYHIPTNALKHHEELAMIVYDPAAHDIPTLSQLEPRGMRRITQTRLIRSHDSNTAERAEERPEQQRRRPLHTRCNTAEECRARSPLPSARKNSGYCSTIVLRIVPCERVRCRRD